MQCCFAVKVKKCCELKLNLTFHQHGAEWIITVSQFVGRIFRSPQLQTEYVTVA